MKPRMRQALIYGSLLATALAAIFAPKPEDSETQPVGSRPQGSGQAAVPAVATQAPPEVVTALLPRPRTSLQHKPRDLFHVEPPPQPVVARVSPEAMVPPPPPMAPPLPYTYMGKLAEQGQFSVFLTRNGKPYVARPGDVLDGQYRVDAIDPPVLELTYLPLAQKQTLNIGTTR